MAVISITISDAELPRVINAVCSQYNYQATVNGSPNPETKAQFAKRMMIVWLKDNVKADEVRAAIEAARTAASARVDSEILMT
jgi:hypothetical protein